MRVRRPVNPQMYEAFSVLATYRIGNLHVGVSILAMVRHAISHGPGGWTGYCKAPREERRAFLAAMIDTHQANRDLYVSVMSGRL